MLLTFTDAQSEKSVAINPHKVAMVFVVPEGEHAGKTVINAGSNNVLVSEDYLEVVGMIQGSK